MNVVGQGQRFAEQSAHGTAQKTTVCGKRCRPYSATLEGEKNLLGKRGKWKGDDLAKMLLEHPATADRLAFRVCELFMGEDNINTGVKAFESQNCQPWTRVP